MSIIRVKRRNSILSSFVKHLRGGKKMVNERNLKDSLYQEFAKIGKCLSSPKRLELLDLLVQGPKSVEDLAAETTMSVANVSQHLRTLYNARMVTSHKDKNYVIYELVDEEIVDFLESLYVLSEKQLMEVQRIKQEFSSSNLGLEEISLKELDERMEKGEILLLDVRPKAEYEKSHIPGAVSTPVETMNKKITSLPTNREVVVYCRGSYCLISAKAVELLKEQGINAYRLQENVQDWYEFQEQMS